MKSLIHKMSFQCNFKFTKKLFLKILIFLIGLGFLSLQLSQTFQTFIEKRSTFVISQKIFDRLIPPTIVLCLPFQKNIFLNKRFNITIKMSKPNIETESLTKTQINLTLGENYDEQNELMLTVAELVNPFQGLCYTLTFNENHQMNKMGVQNMLKVDIEFLRGMKIPTVDISLVSSEDNYGFILPQVGRYLRPSIISLEAVNHHVFLDIKTIAWNYLPSNGNCKDYSIEAGDSTYIKCLVKKTIDCAINKDCKCTPEKNYKSYFELYPTFQKSCKNKTERTLCKLAMRFCYRQVQISKQCPLPCNKIAYDVQKRFMDSICKIKSNQMKIRITYGTTDIEFHNEVLIQELGNFIGTVGGSLGLFIGFSYTGFVGKLIDYFMIHN